MDISGLLIFIASIKRHFQQQEDRNIADNAVCTKSGNCTVEC